MKKIYFLLLCSILSGACIAQPTLTAANSNPTIGQTYEKKLFTPANNQQGNAGANQVWDWTSASEDASGTGQVMSPVGTPYATSYPLANVCYQGSDGSYEYMLGNSTGLFRLGFQSPASGTSAIYSDKVQLLKYPFSLNSTYTDSYSSSIVIPSDAGTFSGTVTITADGWGTLMTPAGTFANVLRVHAFFNEIYVYNLVGTISQTFDQYSYWKPDAHFPLAEYTSGVQGGFPFSSASWTVITVGINELAAETYKMSVYPNPANTNAELTYTLPTSSEVKVEIRDVAGRMVQLFDHLSALPGKNTLPIDAAKMDNGIYILSLDVDGQIATRKMIVNH